MGGSASDGTSLALGFLGVRKAIGLIGLFLPVVLLVGGIFVFRMGQQPTMSDYHGTGMRDVFVGLLCAIGVFLWAHQGFRAEDFYASQFAGTFALVVAVFPNTGPTKIVHFAAAALFFATLALMSMVLFTKSSKDKVDQPAGKRHRNAVYVACGWGILACLALIAAYTLWFKNSAGSFADVGIVFWIEAFAIWFFGIAWLVKGEALRSGMVPRPVKEYFARGERHARDV